MTLAEVTQVKRCVLIFSDVAEYRLIVFCLHGRNTVILLCAYEVQ